jgi:hypothetical protein
MRERVGNPMRSKCIVRPEQIHILKVLLPSSLGTAAICTLSPTCTHAYHVLCPLSGFLSALAKPALMIYLPGGP